MMVTHDRYFLERVCDEIIEVDGGVDAVTYRTCRENGAEALVTGSAYFKAADRAAFVKTLRA